MQTENAIALGFRYGGVILALIAVFNFPPRGTLAAGSGVGIFWALVALVGVALSYYGHVQWQKIRLERDED